MYLDLVFNILTNSSEHADFMLGPKDLVSNVRVQRPTPTLIFLRRLIHHKKGRF